MKENIDKCFCFNISFKYIEKKIKNKEFLTIEDIKRETKASCGCGLCLSYIEDIVKKNNKNVESDYSNLED